MQEFSGIVNNKEVIILYEDDWKPCHLYVRVLEPFNIVKLDDTFPNAIKLSAFLASALATGPARDFLHDHNVPKESKLWDLNYSGWTPDKRNQDLGVKPH
jgi:hypothetical protein